MRRQKHSVARLLPTAIATAAAFCIAAAHADESSDALLPGMTYASIARIHVDQEGNVWTEESKGARRSRFDDAIQTLEHCAEIEPNDPSGYYKVATFFWDKAYRDPLLDDKAKNDYADKGIEAVDKALEIKPDDRPAVPGTM